jgi:hypothetical protein
MPLCGVENFQPRASRESIQILVVNMKSYNMIPIYGAAGTKGRKTGFNKFSSRMLG